MSDWLTYSPTSGHGNGTIILTATSISDLNYRMNTIVAKNTDFNLSASTLVEQRIPPTSITFDSFSVYWVKDIPSSGGTASIDNCNYKVYANYSDGSRVDVSNMADISGELTVSATTSYLRRNVGELELTAYFDGCSATTSVDAYQEGYVKTLDLPLTFEVLSDGIIRVNQFIIDEFYYSKDNGATWVLVPEGTGFYTISAVTGDIVQFKGNKQNYEEGIFEGSTIEFNVYGNIMSLSYLANFNSITELTNEEYYYLFGYCTGLTDASGMILPATTLAESCYEGMFDGCTSLTKAPSLPATTLAPICYRGMFSGCKSLTKAPELPATEIPNHPSWASYGCYQNMFRDCTALLAAPELPATKIGSHAYKGMFSGCTALTTAPIVLPFERASSACCYSMFYGCSSLTEAPELPATKTTGECYKAMFYGCTNMTKAPSVLPAQQLTMGCYESMFDGCYRLTTAPELPALVLVDSCYDYMFYGCSSLNYIKCLANDYLSAFSFTHKWVDGVASSGTFVKNANMIGFTWPTGDSGIPTGWTVVDAS